MDNLVRRLQSTRQLNLDEIDDMANIDDDFDNQDSVDDCNDPVQQPSVNKELKPTDQPICRICLSEEEQPDHLLISPCKCGGSMRYIGLSCLKSWLHGKRHCKKTDKVNSFIWKNLECEICKTPLKGDVFDKDGEEHCLLNYDIHENSKNYLVIDSITYSTSKTIHVVNFDESQNITVGRAQSAPIRITDISVSRHHSNLILNKNGTVSITDNFSKFGTLKLLREPLPVPCLKRGLDEAVYLQVGRVTIALQATPRFSCWKKFSCCWIESNE